MCDEKRSHIGFPAQPPVRLVFQQGTVGDRRLALLSLPPVTASVGRYPQAFVFGLPQSALVRS